MAAAGAEAPTSRELHKLYREAAAGPAAAGPAGGGGFEPLNAALLQLVHAGAAPYGQRCRDGDDSRRDDEAGVEFVSARAQVLVDILETFSARTASLAATALSSLIPATLGAGGVQVARDVLRAHSSRLHAMLTAKHDGEVAGALRLYAALAGLGGGFAREALSALVLAERPLIEHARYLRHHYGRKRTSDGVERLSMTENALSHFFAAAMPALQHFHPPELAGHAGRGAQSDSGGGGGGGHAVDRLFHELMQSLALYGAAGEMERVSRALPACPRLCTARHLLRVARVWLAALAAHERRGEAARHAFESARARALRDALIAATVAARAPAHGEFLVQLWTEHASEAAFCLVAQVLRTGPSALSDAFLQRAGRLAAAAAAPSSSAQPGHVALATLALRHASPAFTLDGDERDAHGGAFVPQLTDHAACCFLIAALETRRVRSLDALPSLPSLAAYLRAEAQAASGTLGSLRLARALRLLRAYMRRDATVAARVDAVKLIPGLPPVDEASAASALVDGCPFTARELVCLLRASLRCNRAMALGARLGDLLRLRAAPSDELADFLAAHWREHGLLLPAAVTGAADADDEVEAAHRWEARMWVELVRGAPTPSAVLEFARVATQAAGKPYALVDEARKRGCSPLTCAVIWHVRRSSTPASSTTAFLARCVDLVRGAAASAAAVHGALRSGVEAAPRAAPAAVQSAAAGVVDANGDAEAGAADRNSTDDNDAADADAAVIARLRGTPLTDMRDIVTSGHLGAATAAMASADEATRAVAYDFVAAVREMLPEAREFRERRLLCYALDVLRNSITAPRERLPAIAGAFFQHALPIVVNPAHDLFAFTNKLLLQQPFWSLHDDVPALAAMMTAPQRRARGLLLRVLASARVRFWREDFVLMERQQVFAVLMAHASLCERVSLDGSASARARIRALLLNEPEAAAEDGMRALKRAGGGGVDDDGDHDDDDDNDDDDDDDGRQARMRSGRQVTRGGWTSAQLDQLDRLLSLNAWRQLTRA